MKKRIFALAGACLLVAACHDRGPVPPASPTPPKERPFNPPGDRR